MTFHPIKTDSDTTRQKQSVNSPEIPPAAPSQMQRVESVSLLGVEYLRLRTADGGDLYLTQFGLPFQQHLDPINWYSPDWFPVQRQQLQGTSTIYRLPTKPVRGVSLNLVVRFSRVGQEIPLDSETLSRYPNAEFNSPFEEFARVLELRAAWRALSRPRIFTKRPLAIYIPAERLELWQTGRVECKIAAKRARHPEIELDILRQYILLYGWIDGLNAVQAAATPGLTSGPTKAFLAEMTLRAVHDLEQCGFRMIDIKPEHTVLRIRPDGSLLRRRNDELAYALVDYELMEPF